MSLLSSAHDVLEKNMSEKGYVGVERAKELFLTTPGICIERGNATEDLIDSLEKSSLVEVCGDRLKILAW